MFAFRRGGVWKPDERNFQQAEIRVHHGDFFIQMNRSGRGEELPGRFHGIADGELSFGERIGELVDADHFFGVKGERILSHQNLRVGARDGVNGSMDVMKRSVPGIHVVRCVVGFDVLIVVLEDYVAGSGDVVSDLVIFNVIGVERDVPDISDRHRHQKLRDRHQPAWVAWTRY